VLVVNNTTTKDTEMTNNKQQTPVEWLEKICNGRGYCLMSEYFQQAKEMENSKAFEIFKAGQDSMEEGGKGFEQYYNETYGNEQQ
jgi:hypothetical protein